MTTLRMNILYIIATITMLNEIANIGLVFAFPAPFKPITAITFREMIQNNQNQGMNDVVNMLIRRKRELNTIQSKIIDIVHPQPIVDTIREEEKYGNTGDHTFGKKIVKVVENLSNVINTVFAFPIDTVKKVSRTATEALNNIGGKLVGLQK